jgi:hypothetical protein
MEHKIAPLIVVPVVLILILLLPIGPAASKTPTPNPPTAMPWIPAATIAGNNAISGIVYDANGKSIPDAKVTLYYTAWVGTEYKAKDIVKINNNPQFTSNGNMSLAGLYVYTGLPSGVYMITAEKDGISVSKFANVVSGTKTEDITIDGYVENTPTPAPRPTYKPTPVTSIVQNTDIGAIIFNVFKIALMCVVGLQLVLGIAIIALRVGRRN